jgi:hypothetical protein
VRRLRRSWWGPCGAPLLPMDVFALAPQPWSGRCRDRRPWSSQRGGRGTEWAFARDVPGGGTGPLLLPVSPMASSLSVGIELQLPDVERRWVRIWVLDHSAAPCAHCRLVAHSAAVQRAQGCRPPMAQRRSGGCECLAKVLISSRH